METIGQKIKRFRNSINLSQAALGKKIGVSQTTVSQYEDGTINIPSNQLPLIASALNVAEASLLDSKAQAPKQTIEQLRLEVIALALRADIDEIDLGHAIGALKRRGAAAINQKKPARG